MKFRLIIAMLIAVAAGGCSLPLVSEQEITLQAEKEFTAMRAQMPVSTDINVRNYVYCVAMNIVNQLEEPYVNMDWEIEVFEDPAINAFAMPGGKIGVFTGILEVAENQDQLGAVIGHEVAHVTANHSVERANRELTTQGVAAVAGAAVGGGTYGDLIQYGAHFGLSLPYGRGQESEADVIGLDYMSDAGFDPRASVQLWKNMAAKNKGGPPEFMSTHPSSDTRIDDLISELPEALARYNKAKSSGRRPNCQQ